LQEKYFNLSANHTLQQVFYLSVGAT
jgi:hypothetical protein